LSTKRLPNKAIILACALLVLAFAACTQAQPTPTVTQMVAKETGALAEPVTIRIAVLPITDALPMYVAQQSGYFQAHGVKVEFIPSASAAERDQIIAAGQADGMINEIVATLLYNHQQVQIQIVRFARVASAEWPQYYLLASGKSGITTVEGLKGVEIGVSEGTIIEYVTDRMLQAEGFNPEEIKVVAVPKISDRMALLSSGELKAGTLPDPLAFLAIQQGAVVVLDDSRHPGMGHSTYAFRKEFINQHPEAIRSFLAALEQAIGEINAAPEKWDSLLSEQKLVPDPLIGSYQVPQFPTASVPGEELWNDVLAWAKAEGLVQADVAYQDSVNPTFLP